MAAVAAGGLGVGDPAEREGDQQQAQQREQHDDPAPAGEPDGVVAVDGDAGDVEVRVCWGRVLMLCSSRTDVRSNACTNV